MHLLGTGHLLSPKMHVELQGSDLWGRVSCILEFLISQSVPGSTLQFLLPTCWPPCATSKAWSHRGVQGWDLPGPGCVLLINQKSCRLWLTDGVRVRVCVLSLPELWLFVIPKPKEERTQFSRHKEQKGLHYSLVCLKQTDQ